MAQSDLKPAPSSANTGRQPKASSWFSEWLTLTAFYYPIFWISSSIVGAGPALVRWAFFGSPIRIMFVNRVGMSAVSWRIGSWIAPERSPTPWVIFAIVLVIETGLWIVGRKKPLAGLAMAGLADAALTRQWLGIRLGNARPQTLTHFLPAAMLLLVAMCLGLRQMAISPGIGYFRRAWRAASGFLPLPLLGLLLEVWRFPWFRWEFGAAALLPPIVAVFLAPILLRPSSRSVEEFSSRSHPTSRHWITITIGACLTLLVYLSARAAPSALERYRKARAQAVLSQLSGPSPKQAYPKLFFQRGVNFTAEYPATYDSRQAREFLARLPKYGINAIALVPYGWTRAGSDRVERGQGMGTWENDIGLEILARVAHRHGMTVMLKPAVWHAFDLQFPQPTERERWFASYTRFILHYARLAANMHADVFSIGGEFTHLTQYSGPWRNLIAAVRRVYAGPLVYAANFGAEFEQITFWDALDYIGLQEYYPLPASLEANTVVAKVEAVEKKYHRPVIFTEVGFPSLREANVRPWDNTGARPIAQGLQAKCYQAILNAFYHKPWFEGMYWWNFPSNGRGGPEDGSYSMWDKPAMGLLAHWYVDGGR